MSVYNAMPHLPAAVESILKQTCDNFVLLIVDDGSTDDSGAYLDSLDDPRIQLIHQENAGLGTALNRGIEEVRTPYVARMDADDISLPTRLEKQLAVMEANPELVMLGCALAYTVDGDRYGHAPPMPTEHKHLMAILRAGGHAISHPTIFCRTDVLRKVGGYRISGVGQDWDLFLRMGEAGRTSNLSEVLFLMRLHPDSNAWKSADKTVRGNAYARACARCRREGRAEPDHDSFFAAWEQRPWYACLATNLRCYSDGLYRKSIVLRLSGKELSGIVCLGLATMVYPPKMFLRLKRKFGEIMACDRLKSANAIMS